MRHVRWTKKTDALLRYAGLSDAEIALEHERFTARCARKPHHALRMSPRLQQGIFRLGVGPEEMLKISAYLDALEDDFHQAERAAIDILREQDRERKARYRDEHRDEYNDAQKLLMRQRRGSKLAGTPDSTA